MLPTAPIQTFAPDMDGNFGGMYSFGDQTGGQQPARRGAFYPANSFQNGYYDSNYGSMAQETSSFDWNTQSNNLPALLASASHNDLLYLNGTYTDLFQVHNAAKQQLLALQTAFSQLSSSVAQSMSATPSASASPLSTTLSIELATKEQYPKVRFWKPEDSKAVNNKKNKTTRLNDAAAPRGGKRMSEDINVMTTYLEKEDGTIISGKEVQVIRATQRSIYREIQHTSPADLPTSWGAASLAVVHYHRAQMYAAHALLRYCIGHWKVERLASQTYSSWYSKNIKKKARDGVGRGGCTCVCTCSYDSPDPSDDEENSDDEAESSSRLGPTSASTAPSASKSSARSSSAPRSSVSGSAAPSSSSSAPSSRAAGRRKLPTSFVPRRTFRL
ncbi:hypothetical protein R3P38DRAFT_3196511 [Favolaschia claudopus]|uniref:Uncharacterized protein n=1 Tax=Favolaschia claudopus TaxID=2862362 RepID=A0AAW0B6M2_9AGAR